jgi:hypothetical protein
MEPTKAELAVELHEYAMAQDNAGNQTTSTYENIMRYKKICWWSFFFAMSAVGW